MKKQIKKTMLWAAAFLALASVSGGAVSLAKAEEPQKTIADVTLRMTQGASVRYSLDDENNNLGNGLRFGMTISSTDTAWLDSTYSSVEYGMLIAPKAYDLSEDKVFGESAEYDWATFDEDRNAWIYNGTGKTRIINITGDSTTLVNYDTTGDTKLFTGSVIDLKEANLTKEFQGVGYIKYTSDSETNYLFATANDNVRSIAYTAQIAIKNLGSDSEATAKKNLLTELYIDKVKDLDTTITIKHYLQADTGEYPSTPSMTDCTVQKKIASTVKASDVAWSDQTVDTEKTSDEALTVYANGKTVVNVYYKNATFMFNQALADKTTNWANKKYISLWSSVNGTNPAYDVTNDGIAYGYFDCAADDGDSYMYFDGDVLKAAAEKGYTNVTFKASAGTEKPFDFWLRAHGPNGWAENQAVYFAGKAQNEEVTIKLSDLKTNDGEYFLAFKMAGWDQNCLTVFHSLTFSSPIKDALNKGFAQENTNWASADYLAAWGSVNGTAPIYDSTEGYEGVAYGFFECADENDTAYMYFDSTILKAAAEKGYTKVVFQASSGSNTYDFWFRAHGPKGWTNDQAVYLAKKTQNEMVTIDLSDLKTSEGEYFLAFKMAGWSNNAYALFRSLTFSKEGKGIQVNQ